MELIRLLVSMLALFIELLWLMGAVTGRIECVEFGQVAVTYMAV